MLTAYAFSNDNASGLSQADLRTATTFIHCRFRGLFSGITHERSPDGQRALVVWGTERTDKPKFIFNRSGDRYLATDESSGRTYRADTIEELLDDVRAQYPLTTAL